MGSFINFLCSHYPSFFYAFIAWGISLTYNIHPIIPGLVYTGLLITVYVMVNIGFTIMGANPILIISRIIQINEITALKFITFWATLIILSFMH